MTLSIPPVSNAIKEKSGGMRINLPDGAVLPPGVDPMIERQGNDSVTPPSGRRENGIHRCSLWLNKHQLNYDGSLSPPSHS